MQYSQEGVGRSIRNKMTQRKKLSPEAADLRLVLGRSEALRLSVVATC